MEDTLPLFESSPYEIEDWAANNMHWYEVDMYAEKVNTKTNIEFLQEGLSNGNKEIVD